MINQPSRVLGATGREFLNSCPAVFSVIKETNPENSQALSFEEF